MGGKKQGGEDRGEQPGGKQRRKRRPVLAFFKWLGIMLLLLAALGAGVLAGGYFWISRDLPGVDTLRSYTPPAVTRVLAADGRLMDQFYRELRYVVPMEKIPRHVVEAFISAEDGDFYNHQGIDFAGILRAAAANFRAGRVVQGGSTITQQVAKSLLLSPKRTYVRKIKEMILARRMEQHLSKEQILYLYLNQIYLGHGAYGVEAAARLYFGKSAEQLTVAEAALLAGLVQAPSRYSPVRHPRRARTRQLYVIERMAADGHITPEQAAQAGQEEMDINLHSQEVVSAPYYSEAVRQWLMTHFGADALYEGGLTVETACNPDQTAAGQEAIAKGLAELTRRQGYRGPLGHLEEEALQAVRARPYAPSGLGAGDETTAVVTSLDAGGKSAQLRFGTDKGFIALEDVEWAHKPLADLSETPERITSVAQVLAPGDQVSVRLKEMQPSGGGWRLDLLQAPVSQAALLAVEVGTGRVRVLIGGRDFEKSEFNRALQARRQPGSAFKPFIYAAALGRESEPMTLVTQILDAPVVYDNPALPGEKWKPKNYENRFYGPTTLRQGLEHSRNVVTVKLLSELGISDAVSWARRLGIESPLSADLSLALGTSGVSLLELTKAYGVFADGGRLVEQVMVERVLDRNGQVIYEAQTRQQQVISPQLAFLMTHLLEGVVQNGTGRSMRELGRPLAGKTGTTNDLRDAWFVGFSPHTVCGVWVGQDDNEPLGRKETGARAAGPIWREFMRSVLQSEAEEDFPVPEGVVFCRVDQDTGKLLPPGSEGGFFEAFIAGTEPQPGQESQGVKASEVLQQESFAE